MSVHRTYAGYVVLDVTGFVVGYAQSFSEAQALLEANRSH